MSKSVKKILIHGNTALTDISGLKGLETLDGLTVSKNPALAQCLVDAWIEALKTLNVFAGNATTGENNDACTCTEDNGTTVANCP